MSASSPNEVSATARWDNLGDWRHTRTFSESAHALAKRLGGAAGLAAGMRVLDVGLGYGAELEVWLEEFGVAEVYGLEPSPERLSQARLEVRRRGLADRVHLSCAPAHVLLDRWLGVRFDAVVALDNAYHFDTRRDFVQGAFEHLKPGGCLAFTDLVFDALPHNALGGRLLAGLARVFGMVPANLVTPAALREELHAAGYRSIQMEALGEDVLLGFARYVWREVARDVPTLLGRPRHWLRFVSTGLAVTLGRRWGLGYVLVVARGGLS